MVSFTEACALYELARDARGGAVVEVGSYRGRSAVALGLGARDGGRAPVFAFDPHEPFVGVLGGEFGPADRAAFYRAMLDTGCFEHVRLVNLSSEVVAPGWRAPIALLFLDGDHTYGGVRRDWDCWSGALAPGATVAFDDATDPELGPARLIAELVEAGELEELRTVGKLRVLRAR
jgi:hypothetical protein